MYKNKFGQVVGLGDICEVHVLSDKYKVLVVDIDSYRKQYPELNIGDLVKVPCRVLYSSYPREVGKVYDFYIFKFSSIKRKEFIPDKGYEELYE